MNNRRKLIVAFGAGALTAAFGSLAQQQGKVWRVGFLGPRSRPASLEADFYGAFPRGMRELGYVEGGNLGIEWRFADKPEQLSVFAAELVRLKVDVIVTGGSAATRAAQKATATIPIIFGSNADPVGSGFVRSLARPGGNISGISVITDELLAKCLEMLLGLAPKLARVALLRNPVNPAHAGYLEKFRAAARGTGVETVPLEAQTPAEIESAFSTMTRESARGLIVPPDPLFVDQFRRIAELAGRNRLLSASTIREFPEAGGLMSYGPNLEDNYRRAATYVDKILKGAKPADLPVEQPTKFEFIINGRTARTLGLKIPPDLRLRADKVIG
jgi:putative tryptophan/tyrosine transport system substrate-binding protein